MLPRIYLAGPTVFDPDFLAIFARRKSLCSAMGFEGVAPLDEVGVQDRPFVETGGPGCEAARIRQDNIRKIASCDAIVADVTPFRGPGADDGTAWEMGFGEGRGKIVLAFSEQCDTPYIAQVQSRIGGPLTTRPDGALLDADGLTVENFYLPANLMLAAGREPILPSFEAALSRLRVILQPS